MIDLIKKLRNCPKETVLYSPFLDKVKFIGIEGCKIKVTHLGIPYTFNRYGQYINMEACTFNRYGQHVNIGECMLFPSKDNKDWEKFNAPHSFITFDKVVCRNKDDVYPKWCADMFSHYDVTCQNGKFPYVCIGACWQECLPYNEETAKLIGTTNEWSFYENNLEHRDC